jgi:hypothetical protein
MRNIATSRRHHRRLCFFRYWPAALNSRPPSPHSGARQCLPVALNYSFNAGKSFLEIFQAITGVGLDWKCKLDHYTHGVSLWGFLRFRRRSSRYVHHADFNSATRIAFLRSCYRQILGPRCHFPKLPHGLWKRLDAWVYLDPHLVWQPAKSYVERGNVPLDPAHSLPRRNASSTRTAAYNLSPLPARPGCCAAALSGMPLCLPSLAVSFQ